MVFGARAVSLSGIPRVTQIALSAGRSSEGPFMCVRIRWSRVAVLWSTLLTLTFAAACASRRAPSARYDDIDRTSMVRGHACDRADQDTTHYLHLPLYRACAVTVTARRVASDLRPEFVTTGRDRNCYTALIEVV